MRSPLLRFAVALAAVVMRSGFAMAAEAFESFDIINWNSGRFVYGADYYPEQWDESLWEKDAAMMQAAGINLVRLNELTWALKEPKEGQFDFSWLDRVSKILNSRGIRAVLGTTTAAPPA